ncbi:MAG: NYN domain-containing protein [Catalinimonas sp.]
MEQKKKNSGPQTMAMLIDGDNARPTLIGKYLTEAGRFGTVSIRRIYGDWTTNSMNGWKESLHNHAVQPVQQFRYTVGKNATDSALIIDAMDVLHGELVEGFCVVSSDSDYTRLATRIRESGHFVMGIGEEKTPRAFVNACNVFIYTENLLDPEASQKRDETKRRNSKPKPDPTKLLREAFELAAGDDDWARLSAIGGHLRQLDPGFDPRTFGFRQLSQLIRAQNKLFQLRQEDSERPSAIYVRLKD